MNAERSDVGQTGPSRPDVAALYVAHGEHLRKVAYRHAGLLGRQVADDAVQEVFLNLLRKYPENVKDWRAYLVTSVKNKVIDLLTKGPAKHEHANTEQVDVVNYEIDQSQGTVDTVAEAVEGEERAALVRAALAEVREEDPAGFNAFWQIEVCDRTSGDVAAEAGVSSSRIRQLKGRARELLEQALARKGVQRG